jgi:hypothetical protein
VFIGITISLDDDIGGLNALKVFGRQLDRKRPDVLVESLKLSRAKQWNDPRFSTKKPSESETRRVLI